MNITLKALLNIPHIRVIGDGLEDFIAVLLSHVYIIFIVLLTDVCVIDYHHDPAFSNSFGKCPTAGGMSELHVLCSPLVFPCEGIDMPIVRRDDTGSVRPELVVINGFTLNTSSKRAFA
jgi:hypothetical protein